MIEDLTLNDDEPSINHCLLPVWIRSKGSDIAETSVIRLAPDHPAHLQALFSGGVGRSSFM